MVLRTRFELEFCLLKWIFLQTSDIVYFEGGCTVIEDCMDKIKGLEKAKRELKSVIMRSLTALTIQLASKEPDCPQVTAILSTYKKETRSIDSHVKTRG